MISDEFYCKKNEDLKHKLDKQIDPSFLKYNKLPDIRKSAKFNSVLRNINPGYNKEMSENYNPYSFVYNERRTKGRNNNGGMFLY